MTTEMNVYQKLQFARVKLQEAPLKKSGHNKFAGYSYFELGDFLPSVQTLFANIGLIGVVSFEGERAFLRITNSDKPEDCIILESPMAEAQLKGCHPVQNLGATQTYLRRYLWVNALEIVEHDAFDASKPVEEKLAPPGSGKRVTQDAYIAKDVEEQRFLSELSVTVKAHLASGRTLDACAALEGLDSDEKVAIWSLFDSKERSAIKAAAKGIKGE